MSKDDDAPQKLDPICSEADYKQFMSGIDATKGKLDAARMLNANEWKGADDLNIHSAVAKLMLKLRKMSDLQRNDFLRSFDAYREYEDFDESDLIDDAEEKARGEAQAVEEKEKRQDEIDAGMTERAEKVVDKAADKEIEDSFDVGDEEDEIVADTAADAYTLGEQALQYGDKKQTNPYDAEADSELYDAWGEGWDNAYNLGQFGTKKRDAA